MKSFSLFLLIFLGVITSNNSYSQIWNEDTSGVNVQLNAVICLNNNRAWCCGNNGTVLKIRPIFYFGGSRWINVSGNGIPSGINLISITYPANDTNIALTTGTISGTTYIYRTSNAGANWQQVFQQVNGHINAMWFTQNSTTNVVAQGNPVGGRWSLFKSTNGGITWDSTGMYLPQNGSETGWNNSAYCYSNYYWFGTNNSRIYYSTNSGINWSVQSTAPEVNSLTITANVGSSHVFTGGSTIMKSTNFGNNWSQIASLGSGNFGGFGNWGNFWWYVRSDNKIYLSSNNGSAWSVQYTAPSGVYTNLFLTSYNMFMYAVRSDGGISKYLIMVGIHPISSEVPEKFSLYQNYPNPFNPQTKIKFDIPADGKRETSNVKLIIYDLLGREVTTLVNEELRPGTYEADWDGSNYSSGVYFYKIISNEFTETRKMVLMK